MKRKTIHSDDYEFYNSESEITVTTCESEENPLETETTTVSTITEISVQSSEEQTESNPVEVYNSDYAVYSDSNIPEGDGSESNPYQISNSSQLFWFADQVNKEGETSINAVLTEDIVVNTNVLNADGTLNTDLKNPIEWTPIGNNPYIYMKVYLTDRTILSVDYISMMKLLIMLVCLVIITEQ